jgi:hypothetical protein
MTWQDRIKNTVFTITTGDGKVFTPLWKDGETSKEFNYSEYAFPALDGELIDRRRVKARQFPLVFWFTGANNIDVSEEFDTAANDPRAWKVRHPFYGDISGHPLMIRRSDANLNGTEITVEFRESLSGAPIAQSISVPDDVANRYTVLSTTSATDYASKVKLQPADVSGIKGVLNKVDGFISKSVNQINSTTAPVTDAVNNAYSDYQQARFTLFNSADTIITEPEGAISALYAVIAIPAGFILDVKDRITLLQSVYNSIAGILGTSTPNNKAYFEAGCAACIAGMCSALVNPQPGDYQTRSDITTLSDILSAQYAAYLASLDAGYVNITSPTAAFSASQETQQQVMELVIETVASLNAQLFNAKQERQVVLMADSNLILLTHKYMGLDQDDVNLEQFRQLNNIKNKKLFNVPKGTKITYLV